MNRRIAAVLGFAFLVSLAASALLYWLIRSGLAAREKPPTYTVIVASHDLQIGMLVRDVDLTEEEWAGPPPPNSLQSREEITGRGVVEKIYEGEPVLESRLAAKGAGAGLAATIPPGMRAVAVRVNEIIGVAGFVVPGMRVDVIISGSLPSGSHRTTLGTLTTTLLQNIEVLSAGQNIEKDSEGKPISVQVVNLLVTPEQAEILSLASNETRIQLVLRNPLDTEQATTPGTATARLCANVGFLKKPPARRRPVRPRVASNPLPPPEPPRKSGPIVVEVLHGTAKKETKFKSGEEQNQ